STLLTALAMASASTIHAEQSKGEPVAFELCTPEGPSALQKCEALGLPPSYRVPAGKLLIIEQVSGSCAGDSEATGQPLRANVVAQTQGTLAEHSIIGVAEPDLPGGKIPLTLTRIYADPASEVTIGLTEVPAFSDRSCRLTFSGQLTKP
ncbi:MAG: hypothetical protein ACREA0_34540, partial [bacterium]